MKQFITLCLAMALTLGAAHGAKRSDKELTTSSFITNIDCPNCTKKVMNVIPFEKGVKDVKVDLEKGVITVSYDKSKSSDEAIIAKLEKLDVKVLEKKAE